MTSMPNAECRMPAREIPRRSIILLLILVWSGSGQAQVTSERLLRAADEPQNWLTYSGGYASQRHSLLRRFYRMDLSDKIRVAEAA